MRVKTNGNGEIHLGNKSKFTCEDVDLDKFISGATISIGLDEVVTATCDVMLTDFEADGTVLKINGITAPDEVKNALRDYFKKEITA